MKYTEYLDCAKKHLEGCESLVRAYQSGQMHDLYVWLELYYLSGYIIEGITVYSAYKLNNWPANDDIQYRYNETFSRETNLDFYPSRSKKINGIEKYPAFFQNRGPKALSVKSHHFQSIINALLKQNPSFNDIPYIGNGIVDGDVKSLIDAWKPEIRYIRELPILNQDIIFRLISTCKIIYSKHI